MAGTILDYLEEYGEKSFEEMPFSDVDSLALCQLSYLKFDGMVPGAYENLPSVTLRDIREHSGYEKLYADTRFEKNNRALFEGMYHSRRFAGLKLNCYINLVEEEYETQFCAVTYLLENGGIYVAYRGTDETIVGWKEDFNLAFMNPVPGQSYAAKYLNMITSGLENKLYVGGHSKGGNLAVYAAAKCIPSVRERILKVYSMDGPGLRTDVLTKEEYAAVEEKIVKILPQSSIIGMLFEKENTYKTVKSKSFGILQHDPFTWLIKDGAFVPARDLYQGRRFMDDSLNDWILSMTEEEKELFVDSIYQIVSACNAKDLIELSADWKKSMNAMIAEWKGMDEEKIKLFKRICRLLLEALAEHMKVVITEQGRNTVKGYAHRQDYRREAK